MSSDSSGIGSVPVPSKLSTEPTSWPIDAGWQTTYRVDGLEQYGGCGVVAPVIELTSGERRALKRPLHGEEFRARFKHEVSVQRDIRHKNVMPILDYDPSFQWFTMPWAPRTLSSAARGMSDEELAAVIIAVAEGLHAAHAKGYVHRDVKPSNILDLNDDPFGNPEWVVADFGIVRRPTGQTTNLKTHGAIGTPGYVAPEVALGGRNATVTARADIYSLGRLIAWATTGVSPTGFDPLEARGHWATLVGRMTDYQPDERPRDMHAVIEGVRSVLDAIRAQRYREWGQEVRSALTLNEERLLAAIFEFAWEPDEDNEEIAITTNNLTKHASSKASLRVGLRRLVELGYLADGWYRGRDEQMHTYSPTEPAWAWAKRNQERLAELLKPPAESLPPGDDDIPF